MKKFQRVTAVLSILSTMALSLPTQVAAASSDTNNNSNRRQNNDEDVRYNEDGSLPEEVCCDSGMSAWWGIIGGTVLGAAAGAGTAALVSGGRGRRGPTGATGATGGTTPGVVPFTLDGNTLTFSFPSTVTVTGFTGAGTATFFVARPDGAVFQETLPITSLAQVLVFSLPPIPSMLGEYTVGLRVSGPVGTIVTAAGSGLVNVLASRDSSNTTLLLASGGTLSVLAASNAAEATAGFVYGAAPNP